MISRVGAVIGRATAKIAGPSGRELVVMLFNHRLRREASGVQYLLHFPSMKHPKSRMPYGEQSRIRETGLLRQISAIDSKDVAGNHVRCLRSQKQCGSGDLFRLGHPSHRRDALDFGDQVRTL